MGRLAAEIVSALALAPERRAHAAIIHFELIDEVEETALVVTRDHVSVLGRAVEALNPNNWTYRKITLSLEDDAHPLCGRSRSRARFGGGGMTAALFFTSCPECQGEGFQLANEGQADEHPIRCDACNGEGTLEVCARMQRSTYALKQGVRSALASGYRWQHERGEDPPRRCITR